MKIITIRRQQQETHLKSWNSNGFKEKINKKHLNNHENSGYLYSK